MTFFLSASCVFSQSMRGEPSGAMMHPQRNMQFSVGNGQRIPMHPNFALIGIKSELNGDLLTFSLYFNDVVDTNSFRSDCVFIGGLPLAHHTEFFFNKNRHMARFSVPKAGDVFSLSVRGMHSFDGRAMKPVELSDFEINTFFKYSREKHEWQKSSL